MRTTLGPPLDHPFELLDGALHDGQCDDRRGEDPPLVVEGPRLVEPLVEGVDGGMGEFGVVPHPLLHQAGQCREHEGPVDALLVHQLEPGRRVAEGGDGLHGLAEDLPSALAVGVPVPEVVLLGTRTGHHLERRVRDVLADLTPDDDLGPAVQVDVVDGAPVAVRQVLGQRLPCLVEMVVRIEQGDGGRWLRHGSSSSTAAARGDPDQLRMLLRSLESTVSPEALPPPWASSGGRTPTRRPVRRVAWPRHRHGATPRRTVGAPGRHACSENALLFCVPCWFCSFAGPLTVARPPPGPETGD